MGFWEIAVALMIGGLAFGLVISWRGWHKGISEQEKEIADNKCCIKSMRETIADLQILYAGEDERLMAVEDRVQLLDAEKSERRGEHEVTADISEGIDNILTYSLSTINDRKREGR